MDNTTEIIKDTIGSDEHIISDGMSEDLDIEHIADDLLGLLVQIGVHQSHVVIAGNDISERRETLLDTPHTYRIRQAVSQVLQLLIGRRARQ